LTLTVIAATFAFRSDVARADHFQSVAELANNVRDHGRHLFDEIRHHLGSGGVGRHLIADTSDLGRTALRIRANANAGLNLEATCRDSSRLDQLVHHMEEIVDDLDHDGHDHFDHDCYHVDVRHLQLLLREIESDVHNLRAEVSQMERLAVRPTYYGRSGVMIGPGRIWVPVSR
jgi:hypothetical protein